MAESLASLANARVKQVSRLLTSKKERDTTQSFVVEGVRLCYEAVLSFQSIKELYLTQGVEEKYPIEVAGIKKVAEKVFYITSEISIKISDTTSPQGIFAICRKLDNENSTVTIDRNSRYLLLDNLQDPGNVGTIIRTAQALGIDGVWAYCCVDIYSPKVLRSAMGGLFKLPLVVTDNLEDVIYQLQETGVPVLATALTATAKPIHRSMFATGGAVVIGNEGAGVSEERIRQCDGSIIIPMLGGAESLNAGVAAGIVIWEMAQGKMEDKG